MAKFLDLTNKADEKTWLDIIDQGHDAKLCRCQYEQDFKASTVCPKYEQYGDLYGPIDYAQDGECQFLLISNSKCFCELQPKGGI
jgi:hypothetical protein